MNYELYLLIIMGKSKQSSKTQCLFRVHYYHLSSRHRKIFLFKGVGGKPSLILYMRKK